MWTGTTYEGKILCAKRAWKIRNLFDSQQKNSTLLKCCNIPVLVCKCICTTLWILVTYLTFVVCDSLHQQYSSYGPSCCLAKRWLSAQLLDPYHFPEMCVELLVASLFLMPEPYQAPNQPQLGFFRFLHLLADTNWNTEPIILNLNAEMSSEYFHGVEAVMLLCFIVEFVILVSFCGGIDICHKT